MADKSAIEGTDATWSPIRARNKATGKIGWHCEHASEGCRNCYAEGINKRLGTGAKIDEDAILAWIEDQTGLTKCEGEQRFLSADGDCVCDFCHARQEAEADRHPEWDHKPVVAGDATWFKSGMGACCSRCGYETFREEGGHAVGKEIVCQECMTIADWDIVDPEHAKELREEDEENCPGHVASESDPKVCGRCGTHIDSLRPLDDDR